MRIAQGGHGHLAPHRLGNAVAPAQIVSYARVPADIGIPSIGQRLSRNNKQVPLLPEGAHEGHVLVTLESLEDVTEPRVTPGPELAVEQKAFDVSHEHDQTESCEKDACDESHQHVHGSPNLSDEIISY